MEKWLLYASKVQASGSAGIGDKVDCHNLLMTNYMYVQVFSSFVRFAQIPSSALKAYISWLRLGLRNSSIRFGSSVNVMCHCL